MGLQLFASRIDVVDSIGEMTKVSTARVDLGVPVVGELNLRVFITGGGVVDLGEAALRMLIGAQYAEAQRIAVKVQRRF
jgi:hypothetical protein